MCCIAEKKTHPKQTLFVTLYFHSFRTPAREQHTRFIFPFVKQTKRIQKQKKKRKTIQHTSIDQQHIACKNSRQLYDYNRHAASDRSEQCRRPKCVDAIFRISCRTRLSQRQGVASCRRRVGHTHRMLQRLSR